jgi:hypothetical protein
MGKSEIIKENAHIGGFKVIRRQHYIETVNNLNQMVHYIDLSYAKADILFHGWVGFRTNDQMKEILNGHFRDVFDDYRCKCMLTDCSRMKGSFSEINEWYISSFMPELASLGLQYNAIILPVDNLAQISVRDWKEKCKVVKSVTFNSLSDAINWLALV